jgi:hypothetical protein
MTIQCARAPRGASLGPDALARGGPRGPLPLLLRECPRVAVLDVGDELVEELLAPACDQLGLDAARRGAAQGREEDRRRRVERRKGLGHGILHLGVAGGVADQHPREGAHLHGVPLPARRLEPRVLPVDVQVLVRRIGARVVERGLLPPKGAARRHPGTNTTSGRRTPGSRPGPSGRPRARGSGPCRGWRRART